MTTKKEAYRAGFQRGREFIGPAGNGSLGSLSGSFVREAAERLACGYRFTELRVGPTREEEAIASAYMAGFYGRPMTE